MTQFNNMPDEENEHYPVEPYYHPLHKIPRKIYDFLASAKLAMFLLVAILVACVVGVTLFRGQRAWELIFSTLWFNGLLVLLVLNVVCCFFGRIWRRKLTIVSFGMILFHMSFTGILVGVIYNSLFQFNGVMRLTEDETLPNGVPQSYDIFNHGRYFNFSRFKGETTLIRVHWGYKVKGDNKVVAYEIAVGEGGAKKQGVIYITKNFSYEGFRYYPEKEGFSPLIVLSDKQGREIYGAFIPLQSHKQNNKTHLHTTGTKVKPGSFHFPQEPLAKPLFDLQVVYRPSKVEERAGEVTLSVWPLNDGGKGENGKPRAVGKATIGSTFDEGDYLLSFKALRYWVGMRVRYSPGQPIVLTSLWVGLAGMIITTIGRIGRGRKDSPVH